MSDTGPTFSAIGVITIDGQRLYSPPVAFGPDGAHLILQKEPDGSSFAIVEGNKVEAGSARFEKTCMEPVAFMVTRDGEPYWKVEVKALFDSMKLDLGVG